MITPIRTPLAKAIRARNDQLIHAFENLGALARIDKKYHFVPAVVAAAEVGNTLYLNKVLAHGLGRLDSRSLTVPLAMAIRNDETDAALTLLNAGALVVGGGRRYGNLLTNALERGNNQVVDSMLESDLDLDLAFEPKQLEIAATWCGLEAIKDLIQMGASINSRVETTALGVAVRSRNNALVVQLLELGPILRREHATIEEVLCWKPRRSAITT